MIFRDTPRAVWMGGSIGGVSQMTKNLINLDLIEIIEFCLKIYDLWRHPHPWVSVWMVGGSVGQWVGQFKSQKFNKS